MKWQKIVTLFGLLTLIIFVNGCFMPASTHCKGTLSIQVNQNEINSNNQKISNRFIIVSLWDYPSVNNSSGKIVINEVFLTQDNELSVDFPHKGYWIVWTPALGTQHLAPDPVIMVFHNNYPLRWIYGSTGRKYEICCAKPETKRQFTLELSNPHEILSPNLKEYLGTKHFFEKFLVQERTLIKKLDRCKGITDDEKKIILEKIKQTKTELEI